MQAVLGGVAACLAVEVLNIGEHKSPRGRLTGNRAPLLRSTAWCLTGMPARSAAATGRLP